MSIFRRITATLVLLAVCATSGIVYAGETGRKNTRNVLGAATVIEAVKGNKGAALVGAAGTIAAQARLDKSIRKRHERAAYRKGVRHGRTYGKTRRNTYSYHRSKTYRYYDKRTHRYYRYPLRSRR